MLQYYFGIIICLNNVVWWVIFLWFESLKDELLLIQVCYFGSKCFKLNLATWRHGNHAS